MRKGNRPDTGEKEQRYPFTANGETDARLRRETDIVTLGDKLHTRQKERLNDGLCRQTANQSETCGENQDTRSSLKEIPLSSKGKSEKKNQGIRLKEFQKKKTQTRQ
jgi:hypothetical protein